MFVNHIKVSRMSDNSDKQFYDNELLEGQADYYTNYIMGYTDNWLDKYRDKLSNRGSLKVLDLGAGSCTTSLQISKENFVDSITAVDISARRMQEMSKETHQKIGGDLEKLEFREIDFNDPLPFENDEFDLVIMDASLHHSRNIWHTLTEIGRVLKKGAYFVAQREAYTSPWSNRITFQRLLKSPEVAAGVSENAYLKSQYDYYLRVHGFEPDFIPALTSWKFKALFFLNGLLFSKYNIVAKNTKEATATSG